MIIASIKFINRLAIKNTHNMRGRGYSSVLTLDEFNFKQKYLSNIKIYRTGISKDPVHDYETLKLFNDLENFIVKKDKNSAIQCVEKFIRNENGIYNVDFGKAKQQLGDILYSHRNQLKITPLDIFIKIGFDKNELLKMGVLETTLNKTKTCVSSTVFEVLIMDTLQNKYSNIKKVYYCQDGAVKIKCVNLTGQPNYDFVVEFESKKGNLIRLAFDSKVQKFDTCLSNLYFRGLKYQILTVGNINEAEIIKSTSFIKAADQFKKNIYKNKIDKVDSVLETEDIMSSPFVATMFVNTEDINNYRQNNDIIDY